jgi:very-short-patch-repair endonuclease
MSRETDDIDRIMKRLHDNLSASWQSTIYGAIESVQEVVESPIELMLGSAMLLSGMLLDGTGTRGRRFFSLPGTGPAAVIEVVPQYEWGKYRIDFALFCEGFVAPVFVECDGHDFHERTKEQAARDRSKDRAIQEAGISILRFTGSEIYRDPEGCVTQIIHFLGSRIKPNEEHAR